MHSYTLEWELFTYVVNLYSCVTHHSDFKQAIQALKVNICNNLCNTRSLTCSSKWPQTAISITTKATIFHGQKLPSDPDIWEQNQVFKAFWKAGMVSISWISWNVVFQEVGTTIKKVCFLSTTRWHSLIDGTFSIPETVGSHMTGESWSHSD